MIKKTKLMMMKNKNTNKVIEWVREYLNSFGGKTKAVIGISGGKDSSVCAAICVKAVGVDRVVGVLMPQGTQRDIDKSYELVNFLGIKHYEINIGQACIDLANEIKEKTSIDPKTNSVYYSNTPSRIRMTVLYGIAALIGDCRVVNTCNRSEDYIGYSTKYGDSAGDFSPLSNLTVREVIEIGEDLGLPESLINKVPEDGLSGKTDEDNLGFKYSELDEYILNGVKPKDLNTLENIEKRHRNNLHKLLPMPSYKPEK